MEDNEVRSEEDSISKQAHIKLVNSRVTCDFIKFYTVVELFEANSGLPQNVYWLERPQRIIKSKMKFIQAAKCE